MTGTVRLTIDGKAWLVSLTDEYWEMVQGLGGVPGIEPGTGMLFDLGVIQEITVTTEPMLFPLDIAFFDEELAVTEVYRDVKPGYLVHSTSPARYFLEVNAGELGDIANGSRVSFESLASESPVEAPDWMTPMISFMGLTVMSIFTVGIVTSLQSGDD